MLYLPPHYIYICIKVTLDPLQVNLMYFAYKSVRQSCNGIPTNKLFSKFVSARLLMCKVVIFSVDSPSRM